MPIDAIQVAVRFYELVEIRLDLLDFDPMNAMPLFANTKTLATCRKGKLDDDTRKDLLLKAIQNGANYVDIDVNTDTLFAKDIITAAKLNKCLVVGSFHDYENTPSELKTALKRLNSFDLDILKLACFAHKEEDYTRIMSLYTETNKPLIAMAIGPYAMQSRKEIVQKGAPWVYAAHPDMNPALPGIPTHEQLLAYLK